MKTKTNIIAGLILSCALFGASCSDMLNTDSDLLLFTEDNRLDSANDSLYSYIGIVNQLKELGDRYVILGELRGDLMDITKNSDLDLQEINNFSLSKDNPYASTREYYAVINNCNYYLQHADTSITDASGRHTMLREFAAVKSVRAWTYMQLALNFGKVKYMTEPILTVEDVEKEYPVLDVTGLAQRLVEDLTPFVGMDYPNYGDIGGISSKYLFVPVELLLGDLYLWMNNPTMAANLYYNYINRKSLTINRMYVSSWTNINFTGTPSIIWPAIFWTYSDELISLILSSSEYNRLSELYFKTGYSTSDPDNTMYYALAPSQRAMDLWANETYTYYDDNASSQTYQQIKTTKGDLRGEWSSYEKLAVTLASTDSIPMILKYYKSKEVSSTSITSSVFLYRSGLVYLRMAEAINMTGRPTLALAVLKNGLNSKTLSDASIVNPDEVNPMPSFCNFTATRFDYNIGIRARGLGAADKDTVDCVIPAGLTSLLDSVLYVDELICKEYALETAFEGNRFHDLMRFAIRRGDPSFLARRVAAKHNDSPSVYNRLLDINNWFLPSE